MKKIVIAYHAYLYGNNYMELITEQLRKVLKSVWSDENIIIEDSLFKCCNKLYIGVTDSPNKKPIHGVEWIRNFFNFASSKGTFVNPKVEVVVYPVNNELRDTLRWIRDYSKNNPEDYILFFHTKGITHTNPAVADWRRYMEYFVIEKWRDCITKLDEGYDCCGVLWNKETPIGVFPHFSGAFYWAKASYINTLDHSYLDSAWRYHMEFWIGSNPNTKVYEFHNSQMNTTEKLITHKSHYDIRYPRSEYTNE